MSRRRREAPGTEKALLWPRSKRDPGGSLPNRLGLLREERRLRGAETLDLTEANPTRAGLFEVTGALVAALAPPGGLDYDPAPLGAAAAREAVAEIYAERGCRVDPSQVVLTASTSEAYAYLFKLLCDPGDEVLVPSPGYPLFEHLARYECVTARPYPLAYDGAWQVDPEEVCARVGPRTRAIVAVSPNNPTGSYLKRDELAGLAGPGLPLIVDEVFHDYPLRDDPRRVACALAQESAPLVLLNGLSKLAGLPGLKLAWIVVGGPPAQRRDLLLRLELLADTFLSVGTPVQLALPQLLRARAARQRAIRERCATNLAWLRAALAGSAVSLLDLEGGWYATLRLPETQTEERWVESLLVEDGVWAHPGWFFDFPGGAHLILSLLTPPEILAAALPRVLSRVS